MNDTDKPTDPFKGALDNQSFKGGLRSGSGQSGLTGMSDKSDHKKYEQSFLGGGDTINER